MQLPLTQRTQWATHPDHNLKRHVHCGRRERRRAEVPRKRAKEERKDSFLTDPKQLLLLPRWTMATTADQLMTPALVSASNGLQSNLKLNTNANTNLNSNEEDQAAAAAATERDRETNKSSSPKPAAMHSLKLHKMGSVSSKEKRVYKIVLTGGEWQSFTIYS